MSKVIVAMSGGVDSSVAALLLKNQGYDVTGITFKNFEESKYTVDWSPRNCCSIELYNNAFDVCESLDIPHYIINSIEAFEENVIQDFKRAYGRGLTPNPCVRCNANVRWPRLISLAQEFKADFVATGHYAGILERGGRFLIQKSKYDLKDQTYALWGLNPDYLARTLFPVGEYSKEQVRKFAGDFKLAARDTPESQDICFVPQGRYTEMLEPGKSGEIVSSSGEVLGRHRGLNHYTVGQRKGLGISYPEPLYVLKIDLEENRLVVGTGEQTFKKNFSIRESNWFIEAGSEREIRCFGKIRYRHEPAPCRVKVLPGGRADVLFDQPQRAITPGQSAVFYDERVVLGGGIIDRVY